MPEPASASPMTSSWPAADPEIAKVVNREVFDQRIEALQEGLDDLTSASPTRSPDVVVMFGDDQSEFFFDDNMPMINVYWGETVQLVPRAIREDMSESRQGHPPRPTARTTRPTRSTATSACTSSKASATWTSTCRRPSTGRKSTAAPSARPRGTWTCSARPSRAASACPTPSPSPSSAGSTAWTCRSCRSRSTRATRRTGSARSRAYDLGEAVRKIVDAWDSDKTVAFACSGGLSHFVVDEEFDRLALKGMETADAGDPQHTCRATACSRPRPRR